MQKFAKRKSPGPDDVPAELLQYGGDVVIDLLHEICVEVYGNLEHGRMTGPVLCLFHSQREEIYCNVATIELLL